MIERTDGNLNLDFLIGLVLFLGAFTYLIITIPGIFLPYQTNSIDLGSVVYRTSCILAEDPGWYDDVLGTAGPEWEDHEATLARVGLAVDKRSPNVLSLDKINALKGLPYETSRDKIGLKNTITYDYALVISMLTPGGEPQELLNRSGQWTAGNVESINRVVLIREGQGLYYDAVAIDPNPATREMNLIVNRSPCFDRTNVTVRLENFVEHDGSTGDFSVSYYVGPYYNDDALVEALPNNEFYVRKNNVLVDPDYLDIESFNVGDKIEIIVDADRIAAKYAPQGLNVSRMIVYSTGFTPFPDLSLLEAKYWEYNTTNPYYRYFDSEGIMTLRVWEA